MQTLRRVIQHVGLGPSIFELAASHRHMVTHSVGMQPTTMSDAALAMGLWTSTRWKTSLQLAAVN